MVKKGEDFSLKGSVLGTFIEHRLTNDRDVKCIITSKGSTTGLGKTMLAILICRWIQNYIQGNEWSAEENGFIEIQRYISRYKSCDKQSALLMDEIEYGADSRRSMAQDNVDFSHAWAQLRYRNVVTVATLPSTSMMDKRMMELADIWINVIKRGAALPFYIWVNDFSGQVNRKQLEHPRTGQVEIINWPDISGDEDYKEMTKLKDQNVRTGESARMYDKEEVDKKVKQARKEKRNEMIKKFYNSEHTNISQSKLGETVGLSQSMIDVIVNDKS